MRTHTKNIYAKLGVTNRRAAVARAHQLNLLVPHRSPLTARPPERLAPPSAKFTTDSPHDVIRPHHIGS